MLVSKFNASNHVVEVGFEVARFVVVGRAFNSTHRSTQMCIEHYLAVFTKSPHDYVYIYIMLKRSKDGLL